MASTTPHKKALILRTPQLVLRAAHESDLNAFHEIFSNDDVMRYWSTPPHTELKQTQEYLTNMIASPTNGVLDFVLVLPSSYEDRHAGRVIGKAGIWSSTANEIGFMLNRKYWGEGYMIEVLHTLLPHLWQEGVEKIVADVDPRNVGSIGILKKFGFVKVRYEKNTVETHLGWCDSLYLELQRPQED